MSARETATLPVAVDTLKRVVDLLGSQGSRERTAESRGYRRGYRRGRAEGYETGYLEAIAEVKAVNQGLAASLHLELVRWPSSGRQAFGLARPGDYPGGTLLLEHPSEVWLGGAPSHNVIGCTSACRSYRAGWYSPDDAVGILSRLPHDYGETISELRAMARAAA
jgi:hypothetical protein